MRAEKTNFMRATGAVAVTFFALAIANCQRSQLSLPELASRWRAAASVGDTYASRCNQNRMALVPRLTEFVAGNLPRQSIVELLGEPELQRHPDLERFAHDNIVYPLGYCGSEYKAFVIIFENGTSVEGVVTDA